MKLCLDDHQVFVLMLNYLLSKYNAHCTDFQKHINFLCLRTMALLTIISHTFYTRLVQQYKTRFYRCTNVIHTLELRVQILNNVTYFVYTIYSSRIREFKINVHVFFDMCHSHKSSLLWANYAYINTITDANNPHKHLNAAVKM